MSDKVNRISRIQSLISRDLASTDASQTGNETGSPTGNEAGNEVSRRAMGRPMGPPNNRSQSILEQERKGYERYQLAQKTRHQRLNRRQELLRADAAKKAERERQKREAKTIEREHKKELREKRKRQFRLGSTISSPAGRVVSSDRQDTSSSDVLLLTQLVQKGQVGAPFSRFDSRSYSPFSHRGYFSGSQHQGYARGLLFWFANFLTSPFFLLWRVILSSYYFAISLPGYFLRNRAGRSGIGFRSLSVSRFRFLRLPLGLWHFSTAPLHMLAHSLIDPLGLFTREPHNYARLPIVIYARIFTQQTVASIRSIPRVITIGSQSLAFFLLAPLFLLSRIVFSPYRYFRQFSLRVLSSAMFDRLDWFYRRTRIRASRAGRSFTSRAITSSRVRGVSLRRQAGQFLGRASKLLVRMGIILKRSITSGFQQLAVRLTRKRFVRSDFGKQQPRAFEQFAAARAVTSGEKQAPKKEGLQELPKVLQDFPSASKVKASEVKTSKVKASELDDRVGLLSKTEDTGLEDFLAATVDATSSKSPIQAAPEGVPARSAASSSSFSDKESVYKEMDEISDNLRSSHPPDKQSEQLSRVDNDNGNDKAERLFEDIDDLDEASRTLLLKRLNKQLEGSKLR